MAGLGTLVNIICVLMGGAFGNFLGHKIPGKIHSVLVKLVGLFAVYVGVDMFLKKEHVAVVIVSLAVGWIVGRFLRLDIFFESLAERIRRLAKVQEATFLEGFITASLIYCIGPMAILGPIEEGLTGGHKILFTKSIIDGITAIGLATSLGIGVLFSAISLALYQGGITLLAVFAGDMFSQQIIHELTSTGGVLIGSIGINILGIFKRKVLVENMLPAIVFSILFSWLIMRLGLL